LRACFKLSPAAGLFRIAGLRQDLRILAALKAQLRHPGAMTPKGGQDTGAAKIAGRQAVVFDRQEGFYFRAITPRLSKLHRPRRAGGRRLVNDAAVLG